MNIDLGLSSAVIGTAAVFITNMVIKRITSYVQTHKESFYTQMSTKFDHMQDWLEGKTGIRIPDSAQSVIFASVRWVEEHTVSDPEMLRKLINYARGRKQNELVESLESLKVIALDEAKQRFGDALNSIPGAKEIVNEFKKIEAEKVVVASLIVAHPTAKIMAGNPVLSKTIDAAATAAKVTLPNGRTQSTQDMIEALRSKNNA